MILQGNKQIKRKHLNKFKNLESKENINSQDPILNNLINIKIKINSNHIFLHYLKIVMRIKKIIQWKLLINKGIQLKFYGHLHKK